MAAVIHAAPLGQPAIVAQPALGAAAAFDHHGGELNPPLLVAALLNRSPILAQPAAREFAALAVELLKSE
jgi:hypothetical protein